MEFWRYYRIIRRRRWLILLGMVICVGAVFAMDRSTPKLYTGGVALMESRGMSKEGVSVYPDPQMMIQDVQLRISNLTRIARSPSVLQPAFTTLNDLGLRSTLPEIQGGLEIAPDRDSTILVIKVTLPNQEDAYTAADVIAKQFIVRYGEINNAAVGKSREFIESQLESTRKAMVAAQDALRAKQEEYGVVAVDMQSQSIVQRLAQAKNDLNQSTAAYQNAVAAERALAREMRSLQEWTVSAEQTSRDPNWQFLKGELVKLETQKFAWTTGAPGQPRKLDNHPDVQFINRQIEETKSKLQDMQETYMSAQSKSKNPNWTSSKDKWIVVQLDKVGSAARREAASAVLADVRSELASMPEKAAKLAELDTNVRVATQTYGNMRQKLDEARLAEQRVNTDQALRLLEGPYVTEKNKRSGLKLMLAFLLSPLLGIGVAFMLHYTDNTVKTAQDAERLLGLPVHAAVPDARAHSLPRQSCPEIIDVAYQMLTSSLWIASQNHSINSFAVVSAEPDAGRTVTASNLAVALAKDGARVVLVDADLRQPAQHLIFGVENKVGLTNVLSGAAVWDEVLAETRVQGLLLVPSGPVPGNPVKLLRSSEMKQFVEEVRQVADFVIFDTPAGVAFPDPVLVSTMVGSAIVVHSAGRVPRGSEAELKAKLESTGVRLLGAVLNKVRREDSSGYFHYHRSYEGVTVGQLPGGKGIAVK